MRSGGAVQGRSCMQGCTGECLHGGGLYRGLHACGTVQERACMRGRGCAGEGLRAGGGCRGKGPHVGVAVQEKAYMQGGAVQGGICMHNSGIAPTQPEHTHHTAD